MNDRNVKNEADRWKGKRYIALARQSDDKDGNASTTGQLAHMRRECGDVGMSETHVILLEGVTGSMPGKRKDLLALLRRKREKNDFDVIAVHVVDRLTRGGTRHGFWYEQECTLVGLELFFVGENMPSGPYSSVVRATMYEAAHEASVSTGRRSTDGQSTAIKNGMFRTAGRTPIGCNRLYCDGGNGRPKFYIRDLANGLQEQFDFETGKLIGTFGTIGKKSRNRFIKQRNEYSLLIPGDPEGQRTVRLIFFLRYGRGWRGCKIADFLNRHGRPAPKGGTWSPRQVECVYENECYTGLDVMGRVKSGRFYARDAKVGYAWQGRSETELATATYFLPELRPREDWNENEQPHLTDFLPRSIRDLAIVAQAEMWAQRLDPLRPRRVYTAHPDSAYLLSNLLKAEGGEEFLVGTLSGPKQPTADADGNEALADGKRRVTPKVAYYRHKGAKRKKMKGSVLNHLIPMKPLHAALMGVLTEVLLDTRDLRSRLLEQVIAARIHEPAETGALPNLLAERDALNAQIKMICQTLSGAALKDVKAQLDQLGLRRNEVEASIEQQKSTPNGEMVEPPEVIVDRILGIMSDTAADLHRLAPETVRMLVHEMVESASVNMATKAVSFCLVLPERFLRAQKRDSPLCLPQRSRSPTLRQTQRPLAVATCEYRHSRGSTSVRPCYECRRSAA